MKQAESYALAWDIPRVHGSYEGLLEDPEVRCDIQSIAKSLARGVRWAFTDWDFPGLRSAVRVDGLLNNRSVADKGWLVQIRLSVEQDEVASQ